MVERYNLRVYGLLIVDDQVLITDEHRAGMVMTKFPGGGLEKGEGLADCLIREFQEELEIDIEVKGMYYVNDFLQLSAFNAAEQLISFYYYVETTAVHKIPIRNQPQELKVNEQQFRWVKLSDLEPTSFTFPIDKKVASYLQEGTKKTVSIL